MGIFKNEVKSKQPGNIYIERILPIISK